MSQPSLSTGALPSAPGMVPVERPSFQHELWKRKKEIQLFCRTEMGRWLAIGLAVLVLIEKSDHFHGFLNYLPDPFCIKALLRLAKLPAPWMVQWWSTTLIVVIVAGACGAIVEALIELYADRLSTCQQEIIFQRSLKLIFSRLENLNQLHGKPADLQAAYDEFVSDILEAASATFSPGSARKRVDVGLMIRPPDTDYLLLRKCNKAAKQNYQQNLEIPLPLGAQENARHDSSGPAGLAYVLKSTIYVPRKAAYMARAKEAWALKYNSKGNSINYVTGDPRRIWRPCNQACYEEFSTILCVPVIHCIAGREPAVVAVLNFSTRSVDRFTTRDFYMAEFFAQVLSLATAIYESKVPIRPQPSRP